MEKLKFGDVGAKLASTRYHRERQRFENHVLKAIPHMRQRYLAALGRSVKGVGTATTYEALVHDRDLLREYGAEVLREAARRCKERER